MNLRRGLGDSESVPPRISNGDRRSDRIRRGDRHQGQQKIPHADFGAATVANEVVFTSDFTGKIYAFATATGKQLWTTQAPAGVNAFPAVTQKMLIVGAGTPGLGTIKKPVFSLVAYELG